MNNHQIKLLINVPQADAPATLLSGWKRPVNIERDGVCLKYKPQEGEDLECPNHRAMDKLIAEFAGLHTMADPGAAIIDFARRWGVLGLCKHGRPVRHRCYGGRFSKPCTTVKRGPWCYEPLKSWLMYSQLISALRRAGDCVRGMTEKDIAPTVVIEGAEETADLEDFKLPGDLTDWLIINEFILLTGMPVMTSAAFTTNAQAARILLMYAILPLLREQGFYLNFSWWQAKRPSFFLSGETNEYEHGGLFGALSLYTMLSLCVAKRLIKCRECPEFFLQRAGRDRYNSLCQKCRQRVSHLEAVKRYVARERQNPKRKKRKRLTPSQRESISNAMQTNKPGTPARLAKKYGISLRAVYKIGSVKQNREGPTASE